MLPTLRDMGALKNLDGRWLAVPGGHVKPERIWGFLCLERSPGGKDRPARLGLFMEPGLRGPSTRRRSGRQFECSLGVVGPYVVTDRDRVFAR